MPADTGQMDLAGQLRTWKDEEAVMLESLEQIESRHGYIPRQIAEEISRALEVKLERLRQLQSKVESNVRKEVDALVDKWKNEEGSLILILHEIQNQHGYVPREVAMEVSYALGVKLARIYEVITFYHYFKLQPPGRHNLSICMGTACYLKGAAALLSEAKSQLKVEEGNTTPDREWHLDVVRCIGCCGMAPTMVVDGKVRGRVKPDDVAQRLAPAQPIKAVP
ncbi:MAG TPA: NAD(P)H-dependent oxidoreductase subunit E [Opitutaceae bacterium]|nr:NAD(P)H-dependent oxidoreductase subunit E [Opitutaceae bacterium]